MGLHSTVAQDVATQEPRKRKVRKASYGDENVQTSINALKRPTADTGFNPTGSSFHSQMDAHKLQPGSDTAAAEEGGCSSILNGMLLDFRKTEASSRYGTASLPFHILNNVAISGIIQEQPTTLEALARLPGVGQAKCDKFGERLLDVVRRFKEGGGLEDYAGGTSHESCVDLSDEIDGQSRFFGSNAGTGMTQPSPSSQALWQSEALAAAGWDLGDFDKYSFDDTMQ